MTHKLLSGTLGVPTLVGLNGHGDHRRAEAERFIHACFERAYGADVRHYLPVLMGLREPGGRLLGALGIREAASGPLFLEHYLDHPVEQVLAVTVDRPVDRAGVTEVGNLAVTVPGGGRWLITALTAYLHAVGQEWVVFTCGASLRNAFHRLGLDLLDLGEADPACLPTGEAEHWGRYYDQRPRVMAGPVVRGYGVLSRLLEVERDLRDLWQGAVQAAGLRL